MINALLVLLVILALLVPTLSLKTKDTQRISKTSHADALSQRGRKMKTY
jgi:hypothetical protein